MALRPYAAAKRTSSVTDKLFEVNWGLVLLLTFVGIIFTFARARTGTVLASFLLHLGYNSMIAVSSIIATKGFQHMPLQP